MAYTGNALLDSTTGCIPASQTLMANKYYESFPIADNVASGSYYIAGFYDVAAAKATVASGGATRTYGTANYTKGARALCVVSGASASATVLTVSGVSITDAGVKNDADSEVLIADCSAVSADQYFQTSKRWLGQITYTLSGGTGGHTLDMNYGFERSKNFDNMNYTVNGVAFFGLGRDTETGGNIEIFHHKATGWTYSAAAFVPPTANVIASLQTDCGTNDSWAAGVYVNWRRNNLSTAVAGKTGGEGVIIRATFATNNSLRWGTVRIGVTRTA